MNDQQWEAKVRAEFQAWYLQTYGLTVAQALQIGPSTYGAAENMLTGYLAAKQQDEVAMEDAERWRHAMQNYMSNGRIADRNTKQLACEYLADTTEEFIAAYDAERSKA